MKICENCRIGLFAKIPIYLSMDIHVYCSKHAVLFPVAIWMNHSSDAANLKKELDKFPNILFQHTPVHWDDIQLLSIVWCLTINQRSWIRFNGHKTTVKGWTSHKSMWPLTSVCEDFASRDADWNVKKAATSQVWCINLGSLENWKFQAVCWKTWCRTGTGYWLKATMALIFLELNN